MILDRYVPVKTAPSESRLANDLFSLVERDQREDSRAAKLSAADKSALAAEFWDELSSNLGKLPAPRDSLTNPTDALKNIAEIPARSLPGKSKRQKSVPVGVDRGCPILT
jgi:hypothetical protein